MDSHGRNEGIPGTIAGNDTVFVTPVRDSPSRTVSKSYVKRILTDCPFHH